jgi:hypothetical protein
VSTGNYVTIFAHLNHIPELSPQNISIYVQQHIYLFIYLYGSQNTAVSTVTRHWAGQPRITVQCLAGARALLQSAQTGSWLWTCPASYSVGIRALSSGEKMSEHEADNSPPPLPTHVTPSLHEDTASLHIYIILPFQNLSLEIRLQPTQKFLQNATNTLHIPLFCAPDY